jgi:hypothetical protein
MPIAPDPFLVIKIALSVGKADIWPVQGLEADCSQSAANRVFNVAGDDRDQSC